MHSELWRVTAEYSGSDERAQREERRLALLSAEGDATAFRQLVERHHGGVYQFVLRIVGSEADAEELAQETFARAFMHIGRFNPTYRLSTWLYRIALNLSRDHLRSAKRRERPYEPGSAVLDSGEWSPEPDQLVSSRYEARRLDKALATLPDTYREVLILKDLEDLSFQEIAQITGSTVAGLKIRAMRARAAMRKQLERMP